MTMTREEAIKELYAWLNGCCGDEEIEPAREAFRMAIEALRVQDVTDTNVGDTIRRQAAIDAINALPSVQPKRIQNNAVHLCDSCQYTYVTCPSHGNDAVFGDGKGNDNICACNKYRPISAQPEIIRCRDCIAYQEGIDIDGKPFTRCNGSVRTYGHTLPDWYCADAERRTDDGE